MTKPPPTIPPLDETPTRTIAPWFWFVTGFYGGFVQWVFFVQWGYCPMGVLSDGGIVRWGFCRWGFCRRGFCLYPRTTCGPPTPRRTAGVSQCMGLWNGYVADVLGTYRVKEDSWGESGLGLWKGDVTDALGTYRVQTLSPWGQASAQGTVIMRYGVFVCFIA